VLCDTALKLAQVEEDGTVLTNLYNFVYKNFCFVLVSSRMVQLQKRLEVLSFVAWHLIFRRQAVSHSVKKANIFDTRGARQRLCSCHMANNIIGSHLEKYNCFPTLLQIDNAYIFVYNFCLVILQTNTREGTVACGRCKLSSSQLSVLRLTPIYSCFKHWLVLGLADFSGFNWC